MSEAKYTPGPWTWDDVLGAGIQIRGPYKGTTRLLFSDIWRKFPEREWDAEMKENARLIAAAPELLEALQEIEDVASFIPIEDRRERRQLGEALDKARSAIAKALGSDK